MHKKESAFRVDAPAVKAIKTTVKVQYDAKIADVDKVKKHLRKPSLGASKVGEYTFDYYLRQEGLK